jgi:glycerophosphoryl diester phosphodiesterase
MHKILLYCFAAIFLGCSNNDSNQSRSSKEEQNKDFLTSFDVWNNEEILIAAHRGDWRHAPENSIQAIQNCIDMGIDIVEIDVRLTKDSILVVIHDRELDRTTNGNGKVSEWTIDSLSKLNLKNGCGTITDHKIPTLEEALLCAKNKIILNLDKSYENFTLAYQCVKKHDMLNQVIFKGYEEYEDTQKYLGTYLDSILFMPIVRLYEDNSSKKVEQYTQNMKPFGFEFTIGYDTTNINLDFNNLQKNGIHVWVNSLTPKHCAGFTDDKAFHKPDSIYHWYIRNNVSIVQTDRPALLLKYLRKNKLHK